MGGVLLRTDVILEHILYIRTELTDVGSMMLVHIAFVWAVSEIFHAAECLRNKQPESETGQ